MFSFLPIWYPGYKIMIYALLAIAQECYSQVSNIHVHVYLFQWLWLALTDHIFGMMMWRCGDVEISIFMMKYLMEDELSIC